MKSYFTFVGNQIFFRNHDEKLAEISFSISHHRFAITGKFGGAYAGAILSGSFNAKAFYHASADGIGNNFNGRSPFTAFS